jgi:hypothetical protein
MRRSWWAREATSRAGEPGRGAAPAVPPPGHREHRQPPGRRYSPRESRHRRERGQGFRGEDEQEGRPFSDTIEIFSITYRKLKFGTTQYFLMLKTLAEK